MKQQGNMAGGLAGTPMIEPHDRSSDLRNHHTCIQHTSMILKNVDCCLQYCSSRHHVCGSAQVVPIVG